MISYGNSILKTGTGSWIGGGDPYNPLNLPPFTMRLEFYGNDASYNPISDGASGTWTHVSGSVWDWTYQNTNWSGSVSGRGAMYHWSQRFGQAVNLCIEIRFNVLGGNTSNVTNMRDLFQGHRYISSMAVFDTSSVTDFRQFLLGTNNSVIGSLPLFPTDSAVNVTYAFARCMKVTTGALALYTQMSTQATPPTSYGNCFTNCGSRTTTGAAELAQIPTSWGGTMS